MSVAPARRAIPRPVRRPALLCAIPLERAALAGLDGPRASVERVGVGAQAARAGARAAVAAGADALVAIGFCGALSRDLGPGDLVVATSVIDATDGRVLACDDALTDAVVARRGMIETRPMIARTPNERTGSDALVLDMESAAIARVAAEHGMPFAAVRAVSDAAETHIPTSIGDSGELRLRGLRPRHVPALITLAGGAASASRALRRAARQMLDRRP